MLPSPADSHLRYTLGARVTSLESHHHVLLRFSPEDGSPLIVAQPHGGRTSVIVFQIDGGCAVHVGVAPHPLTPLHLHLTTRNTRVVLKPEGVGSKLATALQTKPRFSGSPPPNQCTRVDHATFREFNSVVCGTPGTQRHERNKCGKERRRPTKPKFRPTIEPRHIHSSTCMYAFNQKASERCASRTSGASALAAESRGRARAVDRGHALPAPLVWHPPCGTPSCSLTRCAVERAAGEQRSSAPSTQCGGAPLDLPLRVKGSQAHGPWWGGWDSNPRPTDYESAALTG